MDDLNIPPAEAAVAAGEATRPRPDVHDAQQGDAQPGNVQQRDAQQALQPPHAAPGSQAASQAASEAASQAPQDGPAAAAEAPRRRSRSGGAQTAARATSRPRQPKRMATSELTDLGVWLRGLDLGINPAVHINGAAFTNCVMTVDFGTPRKSVRLNTEQSSELVSRLRAVTKTVMARDVKVGVMTDHSAGIWWTTIG